MFRDGAVPVVRNAGHIQQPVIARPGRTENITFRVGLGEYKTNQAMHDRLRKLNETPTMNSSLGKYKTNQAKHDRLRKLNETPTMNGGFGKYNTNQAKHDRLRKF